MGEIVLFGLDFGIHHGKVLFHAYQLHHAGEHLHGQLQIGIGGEGGGDADVAVVGILAVGEGGAGAGEDQANLFASGNDFLGAAVQGVKGDKIAALGVGPGADAQAAQLTFQGAADDLKLGPQNVGKR